MVNDKLLSGQLWVASAHHAAFTPQYITLDLSWPWEKYLAYTHVRWVLKCKNEKKIWFLGLFWKKKLNFLSNLFDRWSEIFIRETTKKYALNEPYPKVLLPWEQELWFYEYYKNSWVLFFSDLDLKVNNKL